MPPVETARYTLDGPAEVEARIAADQLRTVAVVRSLVDDPRLVAVVLAGGYGRGEGGYRCKGSHCVPYNDYDYFVVVRNCSRSELRTLHEALHDAAARLGAEFDLEVDFALFESRRLDKLPDCLMYSELKWRHRVLHGDPRVLDALRSPPAEQLPLAEFSRMMLNRGALLLMNARDLGSAPGIGLRGLERFSRYISKGVLAAGDARLAAAGRYHPSMAVRAGRLQSLSWEGPGRERFLELYEMSLQLKRGGTIDRLLMPGEPQRLQRMAVHEWLAALRVLESARLGATPSSWQWYAAAAVDKGQGSARWWSPLQHLALAAAAGRGRRAAVTSPARAWRHPRERLLAALPLLLETAVPAANHLAAAALGVPHHSHWSGLAATFLDDWRRYC